jgi:tetratricopeptide (TPR) repeat protein
MRLALIVSAALFLAACTTTGHSPKSIRIDRHMERSVSDADRYFEQGQYRTAMLKYSGIVYAKDSDQGDVPYSRYKLGLCHYFLGQYSEALKTLTTFTDQYPDHPRTNEAKEIIEICEKKLDEKNLQIAERRSDLLKEIQRYEEWIVREPTRAEFHYHLADLYWAAGRFRESVSYYEQAAVLQPEYLQQSTLRNRVRIDPSGHFTLREPLLDLLEGDGPVRVKNAKLDRVKRSDWLGEYELLRVSGMVENRGMQDVRNVQIEVTIYDFFDAIQDTRMVNVGALRAGGTRNFSVLMDQFSGAAVDIRKFTTKVFSQD